jgi:small neutral amino acid transporter SnatA (MarC family)
MRVNEFVGVTALFYSLANPIGVIPIFLALANPTESQSRDFQDCNDLRTES